MPGGKTNTEKIDELAMQANNKLRSLDVQSSLIQGLIDRLNKAENATTAHTTQIAVIEKTFVLVDLKALQAAINAIEKEHLALRKDIETLQKWKDELKKEKEEKTRRWWSFGPNITAAIISGIITLIGIGINYYLHRQ